MSNTVLITDKLHANKQPLFENAILTTLNDLYNQIHHSELYSPETEPNCCFIKIASLLSVHKASSHPADLLITASLVTPNFAPTLIRLYEQMPDPKFVIALGGCSPIENSLTPVDSLIPVDTYITECPLRSQTLLNAIASLHHS
jgi:NAD(P)H-quinone oxidoreductase subunit K